MNHETFEWDLPLEQADTCDVDVEADDLADINVDQLLSLVANMKSEDAEFETVDRLMPMESADDFPSNDAEVDSFSILRNDPGLLEAYLDDAVRCLGSLEKAALQLEAAPGDRQPVQQFCRELHTLKGPRQQPVWLI